MLIDNHQIPQLIALATPKVVKMLPRKAGLSRTLPWAWKHHLQEPEQAIKDHIPAVGELERLMKGHGLRSIHRRII